MNHSVNDFVLFADGTCNYCNKFLSNTKYNLFKNKDFRNEKLKKLLTKIKLNSNHSKYDCIIGLSGGIDSSYSLVKAVENNLKPLAVHFDNGWNTELAQNNIFNLVKKLNVDLHTHVVDWEEYKGLMQSFFDSDVVDIELLYDNAMLAVNYNKANEENLKFILAGTNQATEGMTMPKEWNWFKYDKKNIYNINRRYQNIKIKTFPTIGTLDYVYYEFIKKIHWVSFLDYFDYNKSEALNILEKKYDFKPYAEKHYESFFTKFYQSFILPQKFGIDKRLVHLSTLILSNQLSREEALKTLDKPFFLNEAAQKNEIKYFLKKIDWSEKDLNDYIKRKKVDHSFYGTEKKLWDLLEQFYKIFLKKLKLISDF